MTTVQAAQRKPAAVTATTAPQPRRMILANLVKGRQAAPLRVLIAGTDGIGKSTFAATAPAPIFLGTEDGTAQLDVTRFPSPESWDDVREALRTLTSEEHDFKTLALDSLDWLEPLIWDHICRRDGQTTIEGYGYGKGYAAALDEWRAFIADLERLRRAKAMHIVMIAHAWIKPFRNPEGDDFDRYELKLNAKAAGLLKEWSDAVLFANYETLAVRDDKTKRIKGVSTGARLIHTVRTAAWDAKNRFSLPETLPLSWADFFAATEIREAADPAEMIAAITENAARLPEDQAAKATAALTRAGKDATKLMQLNNWVLAKLGEQEG